MMWTFFSEARVRQLSVFWCALIIGGLFSTLWVRVLSSIGIAGLFLTGLAYAWGQRRVAQGPRWRVVAGFGLVYLVHVGTGLLRTTLTDPALGQDLLLELPFVLLPAAFWLLPTWPAAHLRFLWRLLLGCCLVSAAASTGYYLLHQASVEQQYVQSQVMPTTPDHIRFSLLVSMAVVAGLVLLADDRLPRPHRWATLAAVLLLFLFQHLLAVRSGLATLYGAGLLWLGWLGWQRRRWGTVLLGVAVAGALGGASLAVFPTLKIRIINTFYDVAQADQADKASTFSITGRVYSYQVAESIVRRHPWLGVGKVKLDEAIADEYRYMYPAIEQAHYLRPHNQFLFNLAAYGALGLVVFLLGFYYLLWQGLRERNVLLLLIYAIITASFLVEYTLETQIGVVTGLFFLLLAGAPRAEVPAARE